MKARFTICLLMVAMLFCAGCDWLKPQPDPLKGWKPLGLTKTVQPPPSKAITADYQAYIESLPKGERDSAKGRNWIGYSEDGTGQHAIVISISYEGTRWEHILIYDKADKRIKVIKRRTGTYMC